MRFIEMNGAGGPEVMSLAEGPAPEPKPDEVLIEVAWAGVNRPDVLQRGGKYPPPPGASPILGLEVAGKVVKAAGPWKVGDEVCALVSGGGYAELCAAPAPQCLAVPKGMSAKEAAALPETFFTVWTNVFERGRLQKGETILIHGGTSGIGTTAIQLAHAFGARVFATAGSDDKCSFCKKIGADEAINYKTQDFAEEVRRLTDKQGVDLILDMVGGPYIDKNIRSLRVEGRLVQIAFLQESKVTVDFLPMLVRRLTLTGSTLRPRTVAQKGAIAEALKREVWPMLEARTVRPIIHETFPLAEAAAAHRLMESSRHIGKILLQVR